MLDSSNHPEVVLAYKTSKSKQVFILSFCTLVSIGAWIGAWGSAHWNFAPIAELHNLRATVVFRCIAIVYTFFMLPLMIGSVWSQGRAFKQIVLGTSGITLPAKWSGRPVHLAYSDILQINEKLVVGDKRLKKIGGAMTILQLTHTKGRAAIIIENLPSPTDADLIVRTWVIRRLG